ncbi:MAG: tRNA pseudouridine(38-40) synthase TruA [Gemmatimonadota bacterium]
MAVQETRRIAFTVQYDGGPYYGWQLQRDHRTVQGELERALGRIFDRPTRVLGSGRTDRGVHSLGQVAVVDAPLRWSPTDLTRSLNAILPDEIWIARAAEVAADFHPRYGAIERAYLYRVGVAAESASPFHSRWCWPLLKAPDPDLMRKASEPIVGDHSFTGFAKAGQEHRGDRCMVRQVSWRDWEGLGFEFHIAANRFLHHMVRYLVGTLVEIGLGRRPDGDIARLLDREARITTSPPAPPEGLFLASVRYRDGIYPADTHG